MTSTAPTRRALTCAGCGFSQDDPWHYRNCVPTRYWPKELRDRKLSAQMHGGEQPDAVLGGTGYTYREGQWVPVSSPQLEHLPERRRMTLYEYRQTHPEANPLTDEHVKVTETRKNPATGEVDRWERELGLSERIAQSPTCERCRRPMLDRAMHFTCRPSDASMPRAIPRDATPERVERAPKVEDVQRSGPGWWNAIPEAPDPEPDEAEMRSFITDPQAEVEARVRAEMEQRSVTEPPEAVHLSCECGYTVPETSKNPTAAMRMHRMKSKAHKES